MFSLIVSVVPKHCCNFQPRSKALIAAAAVLDLVSGMTAFYGFYRMLQLQPRQISPATGIAGAALFMYGVLSMASPAVVADNGCRCHFPADEDMRPRGIPADKGKVRKVLME